MTSPLPWIDIEKDGFPQPGQLCDILPYNSDIPAQGIFVGTDDDSARWVSIGGEFLLRGYKAWRPAQTANPISTAKVAYVINKMDEHSRLLEEIRKNQPKDYASSQSIFFLMEETGKQSRLLKEIHRKMRWFPLNAVWYGLLGVAIFVLVTQAILALKGDPDKKNATPQTQVEITAPQPQTTKPVSPRMLSE